MPQTITTPASSAFSCYIKKRMRSCEGNVAGKKMEGGGCHQQWFHLWVLIDFLLVLLVAINVKPNGCPGTACPAEPEDDP